MNAEFEDGATSVLRSTTAVISVQVSGNGHARYDGDRGSLGRKRRDHGCGYRGSLLTRQHCRCNNQQTNNRSVIERKNENKQTNKPSFK